MAVSGIRSSRRGGEEERGGYPVLGGPEAIGRYADAVFVPDNEWPKEAPLTEERLVSIVDPSSFVSRSARIGRGCVIYPNSFVGRNAMLGRRVFCLAGCVINHDVAIADDVVLASAVTLAGHVRVESGAYLGQGSSVRQYISVGRASFVGMGVVVVKDVPANTVVAGNPARVLRHRSGGP